MKRRGLKVKTGVRAPALIPGDRRPETDAEMSARYGDSPENVIRLRRLVPVGLAGIANMAPLVVGPRCTMPVPCGSCWFCKTWEDREMLKRFTGTPNP